MPEKDKKTVIMKSGLSAVAPYVAIGVGGYLLLKAIDKKELPDFGIPNPWEIAGGAYDSVKDTVVNVVNETSKAVSDIVSLEPIPPEKTKSPQTVKAIEARKEAAKPWTLKPETTKALESYVSTPGGVVEEQLEKYFPKKVPTGVLSEYTPKIARETVFEDKSYKGPSLFGWLFKPISTKKTASGVYVPGYGIAQNVTLPKGTGVTTKQTVRPKTPTGGRVKVGGSFGSEEAEAKKATRVPGTKARKKTDKKLTVRRA